MVLAATNTARVGWEEAAGAEISIVAIASISELLSQARPVHKVNG
jgi:hypothetical protein